MLVASAGCAWSAKLPYAAWPSQGLKLLLRRRISICIPAACASTLRNSKRPAKIRKKQYPRSLVSAGKNKVCVASAVGSLEQEWETQVLPLIFVLRMLIHKVELVRKKRSSSQYLSTSSHFRQVPGSAGLEGLCQERKK